MTASKDTCEVCKKAFYGKQKHIRCCGPCASRFHVNCLKMSEVEYSFLFSDGVSTYKCRKCVKALRGVSGVNTPPRILRSASASEIAKKVVSPVKEPILPDVGGYESLAEKLEMVRLNGACTHNLVENLVQLVLKLSEDVQQLRKDNEYLKEQLSSSTPCAPLHVAERKSSSQRSSTAPSRKVPEPSDNSTSACAADVGVKSYKDVALTGLHTTETPTQVDTEGFITVHRKRKPNPGTPVVHATKQRRQPLIGVRNSASLPVISKKERSKALFVSRFSPEVTTSDIEASLKEQLRLKNLVCTRLKTKFSSYSSFHVSVNEDEFPLINNTGVWPNGCLIAPFYGRLTSEQVYSSSAPVRSTESDALPTASVATVPGGGSDSH